MPDVPHFITIFDPKNDLKILFPKAHLKGHLERMVCADLKLIKWGASSRWSFRPNSAWGSIGTTIIGRTRPTLQNDFHHHNDHKAPNNYENRNSFPFYSVSACFFF